MSLNPEAAVSSSSLPPPPPPPPPQPQPTDTLPAATAAVFAQFAAYDWAADQRFQAGLKSILPPPPPPTESNATTPAAALEQAKFFYFSKFIHPIEKEPYLAWKASSTTPTTTTTTLPDSLSSSSSTTEPYAQSQIPPPSLPAKKTDPATSGDDALTTTQSTNLGGDAQYPRSFQEICEMVARGDEVPGIRQIPDKLNDAPPSTSALGPRKKPWEKE
ncbi:hypothetical protein HDU89_004682 [Geranomyces variabilis]|nr:hypothetical protein HDU89_004682 [Geranomyces variabilis]